MARVLLFDWVVDEGWLCLIFNGCLGWEDCGWICTGDCNLCCCPILTFTAAGLVSCWFWGWIPTIPLDLKFPVLAVFWIICVGCCWTGVVLLIWEAAVVLYILIFEFETEVIGDGCCCCCHVLGCGWTICTGGCEEVTVTVEVDTDVEGVTPTEVGAGEGVFDNSGLGAVVGAADGMDWVELLGIESLGVW